MRPFERKGQVIRAGRFLACGIASCLLILLAGCAPGFRVCPPGAAPHLEAERLGGGWWYASFKIRWPEGEEYSMHIDLMIAHKVAAPVLDEFKNEIHLWRFHRRAARDEAGHRFSLILYCPPEVARKAFSEIDSSIVLEEMKSAGIVEKVSYDDTNKISKGGIDGVSDKGWSKAVQRSWPWFITGVSETWLDLIDQYANDGRPKPLTLDETIEFYRGIDQSVREAWMKEGAHAFLHHLNALFGYGPVTVQGKYQMRF